MPPKERGGDGHAQFASRLSDAEAPNHALAVFNMLLGQAKPSHRRAGQGVEGFGAGLAFEPLPSILVSRLGKMQAAAAWASLYGLLGFPHDQRALHLLLADA